MISIIFFYVPLIFKIAQTLESNELAWKNENESETDNTAIA